ncbi:hypothetical protein ACVOMV_31230 [Mesorhizobium atlanticum]
MDASELQAVGDTLMRLVTPSMTPKDLVKAVRRSIPAPGRRTSPAPPSTPSSPTPTKDPGKSRNLRAFALAERTPAIGINCREL